MPALEFVVEVLERVAFVVVVAAVAAAAAVAGWLVAVKVGLSKYRLNFAIFTIDISRISARSLLLFFTFWRRNVCVFLVQVRRVRPGLLRLPTLLRLRQAARLLPGHARGVKDDQAGKKSQRVPQILISIKF